jgi:hypothetical protein
MARRSRLISSITFGHASVGRPTRTAASWLSVSLLFFKQFPPQEGRKINGSLRDEYLNTNGFMSLADARASSKRPSGLPSLPTAFGAGQHRASTVCTAICRDAKPDGFSSLTLASSWWEIRGPVGYHMTGNSRGPNNLGGLPHPMVGNLSFIASSIIYRASYSA